MYVVMYMYVCGIYGVCIICLCIYTFERMQVCNFMCIKKKNSTFKQNKKAKKNTKKH